MNDKEAEGRNLGIEITMSVRYIGRYERALDRYGHEGLRRDLSPLLANAAIGNEAKRQTDS